MLEDQRVISTSAVRCVGNTLHPPGPGLLPALRHHGHRQPDRPRAALDRSPSVAYLPQWVDAVGRRLRRAAASRRRPSPPMPAPSTSSAHRAEPVRVVRWTLGVVGDCWSRPASCCCCSSGGSCGSTDVTANRAQDATVSPSADAATSPTPPAPGARRAPRQPKAGRRSATPSRSCGSPASAPTTPGRCSRARRRDILQDGIGHYAGTELPGAVGNFAVAGHRTTTAARSTTSTPCAPVT